MIMPTQFVASLTHENNPFAVTITRVIGIPFYIRAGAVISLSPTLAAKGLAAGAGYLYAFLF